MRSSALQTLMTLMLSRLIPQMETSWTLDMGPRVLRSECSERMSVRTARPGICYSRNFKMSLSESEPNDDQRYDHGESGSLLQTSTSMASPLDV